MSSAFIPREGGPGHKQAAGLTAADARCADSPTGTGSESSGRALPRESEQTNCHLRIVMALRRIMHFVDAYSRKLSLDHHVTLPQIICLQTIVHDGPITLSALGKLVSLSMSTVNGIVDRLEAKQLVERRRADTDRRKVLVSTTQEGIRLSGQVPLPLQDRLLQAVSELPEAEQTSIALSLERIAGMMEERQSPETTRKETLP